ncbi:MAG: alpha-N-acetylglucosaminidase [Planctomycetota bacterium]|jgi:alpha-N-acetylglucosaminidase
MHEMVERLFGERSVDFHFETIPSDNGKDVFEIESENQKLIVRGNNGVSMARGLNWYLKYYCHQNVAWDSTRVMLQKELPEVSPKLRKSSWARDRYFLNYCAFGYSMAWWDWEQWEMLIDWMALNGINLPLSVTGQEAVWQGVCQQMGMTHAEINGFFSGATYLPFCWMGCLDSYGGPLPQGWIESHEKLQVKILNRERRLGMRPVLQGFTGHVPEAIIKKYPNAKSQTINWGEWETHLLDPNDKLFKRMAALYLQVQNKLYGTDHIYAADAFIEMIPPSGELDYLADLSKAIYNGMAQVDSQAVWLLQSWPFMYRAKFWSQDRIQAFLNAIDDDKMILLDLWCENTPVWSKTHSFYGKPWIWCNIQNFGNKTFMGGNLDLICTDLQEAKNSPDKKKMSGAGFVNEGLGYNPIIFEFLFELTWSDQIDLDRWVQDYANCRYGQRNSEAQMAWEIIQNTVYKKENSYATPYPILMKKPSLQYAPKLVYDNSELVKAWRLLQGQSDLLSENSAYGFDLINIARQCLTNHAQVLYREVKEAYTAKDKNQFESRANAFVELLHDMDDLVSTRKEFLLGAWLENAKRWGDTQFNKDRLEWNARRFITLWGETKWIDDYAGKEWAGMLKDFYAVRWQKYFDVVELAMEHNQEINHKSAINDIFKWEYNWASQRKAYPSNPKGNSTEISRRLLAKYF